ncbi:TonB-dependent receptor [Novosphingobium aerophilum]|uniref:TonB-dependent receptor n=1 Tax=Novosphingobium aerophilum TaxID=2839843 RepID=UPI003FD2D99D
MRFRVAHSVCTLAAILWPATGVLAQSAEVNVPSQPLSRAIAQLGQQAGVEILLNTPGQERRLSRTVKGHLSAREALQRMIRGMDLETRQVSPGVYLVLASRRAERRKAEPRPPTPDPSPDILVSARRRPEREIEVPLQVVQRDAETLDRASIRTLADLARITPGFVATGQTSSATPLLVMRGQRRSISDENRLPLVVYQDEVPLPNQAAVAPLYDMASIEVLRGPQGTLFGRNTTSGAVQLHSVLPGSGVPGYLEAETGTYGLSRLEGALELPREGPWSLRVSGQRMRRNGYTHMASGGRADTAHSDAMRAMVRFEPESPLRSTLSFDMLDAEEMGAALILAGVYETGSARNPENVPYFDCGSGACDIDSYFSIQQSLGRRTSQSGIAPIYRRRFRGLGNITEYGDEDLMVRNILGWRSTRVFYALDGDGTPLEINDSTTRSAHHQWTEEFQLQGRLGKVRYIAGLFYLDSAPSGAVLQDVSRFVRPDNPPFHVANYQTFRSAAVFGQATVPIGDELTADLGLRYTAEQVSGCTLRSLTARPATREACLDDGGSAAKAASQRLTWTFALTRKLGDHSFYLTSRRAFRSGGYNTPRLAGTLAPYQTFKPETLTDLEIGAKGRWSAGNLGGYYSAAAYAGLYTNVQRALFPDLDFDGDGDITTDPITLYINSAKARVAGFDGEFSANLDTRTHVTLSASWIHARYTEVVAPAALISLLGTDPLNNRFTYTPSFSGTVSLSREVPLPHRLGELSLAADYSYVSAVRFTERPSETFGTQPAYGLLGASITWQRIGGMPLDLEIWGRNLTDRFYASGGGTLNPAYAAATIIPGPPRTMGLRLRYTFE